MDRFRCVLEVAKCSAPEDVLLSCSLVCKQWSRAVSSDELWIELCGLFGFAHDRSAEEQWSELFRRQFNLFKLKLIVPCARHYWVFRCYNQTWRKVKCDKRLNRNALFVLLPDESAFYYSSSDINSSLQFRLTQRNTQILPRPATQRQHPAGVYYKRTVYVFGGLTHNHYKQSGSLSSKELLKSSEALHLTSSLWKSIPDMLCPRSNFTVALHRGLMYLCGGQTDASEVFDPETGVYRMLGFRLSHCMPTWAVVADGELIVISGSSGVRGKVPQCEMQEETIFSCLGFNFTDVCASDSHVFGVNFSCVFKRQIFLDGRLKRLFPSK